MIEDGDDVPVLPTTQSRVPVLSFGFYSVLLNTVFVTCTVSSYNKEYPKRSILCGKVRKEKLFKFQSTFISTKTSDKLILLATMFKLIYSK